MSLANLPDYKGTKKRIQPRQSRALERPGRMKRLNARLREDPEFVAQFAASRAERMKVMNAKHWRKTAADLDERTAARQRIEDEKRRIDDTYCFECPEGTWTGRLEEIAWRNSTDLILCFTDTATGEHYRVSRHKGTHYKPTDGSHDFRHDAARGDVFELTIKRTVNGYPNLKSARKIQPVALATPTTKPTLVVTVLPSRRHRVATAP